MNPAPASLDRLHDVIAPPPAPWWPPTPGWWLVMALAAAVLVALIARAFIHWQRNRYRREALAKLRAIQAGPVGHDHRAAMLAQLAELLKRGALSAFPRELVASLTGPAWFAFLDRAGCGEAFSSGAGATLERAAYDPRAASALDDRQLGELLEIVRHWLAQHTPNMNGEAERQPSPPSA